MNRRLQWWGRSPRSGWVVMSMLGLIVLAGCGRSEIKGTYDVELQILGVPRPLTGTLILSTMPLDIPALSESDAAIDSNWFGGDALAANSCFILSTSSARPNPSSTSHPGEAGAEASIDPGVVRVFEARIEADGVKAPIEILNASDLQIQITSLQFFAGALGGDLEIQTADGLRAGRIHGARVGAADQTRCTESLAAFRAFLRSLSAKAVAG